MVMVSFHIQCARVESYNNGNASLLSLQTALHTHSHTNTKACWLYQISISHFTAVSLLWSSCLIHTAALLNSSGDTNWETRLAQTGRERHKNSRLLTKSEDFHCPWLTLECYWKCADSSLLTGCYLLNLCIRNGGEIRTISWISFTLCSSQIHQTKHENYWCKDFNKNNISASSFWTLSLSFSLTVFSLYSFSSSSSSSSVCSAGQVKAPFPPTNVHACEVSDTYVVLSWAEPEPRGRETLNFYVERVSLLLPHIITHTHTHYTDKFILQ